MEAMEAMGWLPKLQFLNDFDVLQIAYKDYKAVTATNKSPDIFDSMGHSSLFMSWTLVAIQCESTLQEGFAT